MPVEWACLDSTCSITFVLYFDSYKQSSHLQLMCPASPSTFDILELIRKFRSGEISISIVQSILFSSKINLRYLCLLFGNVAETGGKESLQTYISNSNERHRIIWKHRILFNISFLSFFHVSCACGCLKIFCLDNKADILDNRNLKTQYACFPHAFEHLLWTWSCIHIQYSTINHPLAWKSLHLFENPSL